MRPRARMREIAAAAQSAHYDADLRDSIAWVSDAVRAAAIDERAEPRTHPPAPAPLALDTLRGCLLAELGAAGSRAGRDRRAARVGRRRARASDH